MIKNLHRSRDAFCKGTVCLIFTFLLLTSFLFQGCTGFSSPAPLGRYENDLREGAWDYFYPGGALWVRCGYQAGRLHGTWNVYFPDGAVQESGAYAQGARSGEWEWFYAGGTRYIRGRYVAGKKEGFWESNTLDGKPWWRGEYRDGKKTGKWEAWRNGRKAASGFFLQGRRHGVWKAYDGAGRIRYEGRFTKGHRTHTWKEFDTQGRVIRTAGDVGGTIPGETDEFLAFSDQFDQKIQRLRRQLTPTFRLSNAGPFLVASELPRYITDTYRTYSITWLHEHMMQEYCHTPPSVGEKIIFLFLNQASYDGFMRKQLGRRLPETIGVTTKQAILVNAASGSGTLVHELVHSYLQADFPGIPDWLEEGISTLYEQSAEVDGRIIGLINFRLQTFREAMLADRLIPLKRLLRRERAQYDTDELDLYYAQVRYFCYYLVPDRKHLVFVCLAAKKILFIK